MTTYLSWTELKLLTREPLVLVVSLLFPVLLMVLLLASFDGDPTHYAPGLLATEFYVTAYLSAAVAVMGFMAVPTHLAAYRDSGVLRRHRAAGLPARSILLAQAAVLAALAVMGAVIMVGLAYAGFDLAAPVSVAGVVAGFAAGVAAFAGIGALLGSLLPNPRVAQGVGLLLFFGTFFVCGGGPPPELLPDALNTVASYTPIGLLVEAVRAPWSGQGLDLPALVALLAIALIGFVAGTRKLARE